MAYCSECGVYYTGDGIICSSCGINLHQVRKLETEISPVAGTDTQETGNFIDSAVEDLRDENIEIVRFKKMFEKEAENKKDILSQTPCEAYSNGELVAGVNKVCSQDKNANNTYSQTEGHLGKGIIKPQKVELATDGIHFKYDTPSHNFIKAEPVKERPREYRVTSSDMELKTFEDVITKQEPLKELLPPIKENENEVREEPSLVEIPEEQEELEMDRPEIDIPLENESEIITETVVLELITEPVLPEPELPTSNETDNNIIWEATQTWLKIPLGNIYRLTQHSLVILGKNNNKLLDVNLSLITEVSVRQSWLGKLLGVGDLLISIPQFAAPKVVLGGISEPNKAKQLFEKWMANTEINKN
jgi:hypothetical protein